MGVGLYTAVNGGVLEEKGSQNPSVTAAYANRPKQPARTLDLNRNVSKLGTIHRAWSKNKTML